MEKGSASPKAETGIQVSFILDLGPVVQALLPSLSSSPPPQS